MTRSEETEHPEWEWQPCCDLAALVRSSSPGLRKLVRNKRACWLHYERAPAEDHPEAASERATWVYRIRPGYPMHMLDAEGIEQIKAELARPAAADWDDEDEAFYRACEALVEEVGR